MTDKPFIEFGACWAKVHFPRDVTEQDRANLLAAISQSDIPEAAEEWFSNAKLRLPQTYPSRHPPGSRWSTTAAWAILDLIKPGIIPDDVRAFLAGSIAGRLEQERMRSWPD